MFYNMMNCRVLMLGGSGGIGTFAIQVYKVLCIHAL